jgi:hypothetical protein
MRTKAIPLYFFFFYLAPSVNRAIGASAIGLLPLLTDNPCDSQRLYFRSSSARPVFAYLLVSS